MNHAQFWGGGGVTSYQIEQSLRLPGGQYLSKTSGTADNSQIFTYSFWSKLVSSRTWHLASAGGSGYSGETLGFEGWQPGIWRNDAVFSQQGWRVKTSDVFRDPTAWYHFVYRIDRTQTTATNCIDLWINGVNYTNMVYTNDSAYGRQVYTANTCLLNGATQYVPSNAYADQFYIAEAHFVDGSQVAYDQFGEFDDNGVWRPIEYTGSHGSNGWYLKFDPSATNGIGHDHSGNGNDFTPTAGISTSGTGTDVMSDTPTKNWCTWNPLDVYFSSGTFSNGNLDLTTNGGNPYGPFTGSIGMASGKWYWEITPTAVSSGSFTSNIGILQTKTLNDYLYSQPTGYAYRSDGQKGNNSTISSYGASYAINDVIGVAYNADSGSLEFYKNGTSQGVAYTGLSGTYFPAVSDESSTQSTSFTANFGQRDFAYTPPTGYKALNTANLPAPDIADGSQHFDTVLYRAATSNGTYTHGNLDFRPDFTWIKNRNNVERHFLIDVIRGNTNITDKFLTTISTATEGANGISGTTFSVTDTGYQFVETSIGSGELYFNSRTYVGWNWLAGGSGSSIAAGSIDGTEPRLASTVSANPSAGFSIVSYTGTGANATVGHGLGVAPKMVIIKNRDVSSVWAVYHQDIGATKYLNLSSTAAAATYSLVFNDTSPTSTVFSIGTAGDVNNNTNDLIAYCFAEVEGFSKIGTFTGNANTDGVFVYCGFKPAWIMIKRSHNTSNWSIFDTARGTYNSNTPELQANTTTTETALSDRFDILSNGFKFRSSVFPNDATAKIFVAFAEHPFGGEGVSPATAR